MRSLVVDKLRALCETLVAERAFVGFFARVRSHVHFEDEGRQRAEIAYL